MGKVVDSHQGLDLIHHGVDLLSADPTLALSCREKELTLGLSGEGQGPCSIGEDDHTEAQGVCSVCEDDHAVGGTTIAQLEVGRLLDEVHNLSRFCLRTKLSELLHHVK